MIYQFKPPTKTLSEFSDTEAFPVLDFGTDTDGPARYTIFKTVVRNWYDTRVVCDDDNFPRYFQRVIVARYPQYEQLLRVQPGVQGTQYDWLVEDYREALLQGASVTDGSTVASGSETSDIKTDDTGTTKTTTTGATSGTGQTSETGKDTGTRETTGSSTGADSSKTTGTNTVTDTSTGKTTTTKTGSETHNAEHTGTDKTETDSTLTKSGTETSTKNLTDTRSPNVTHTTTFNNEVDKLQISGAYLDMHRGTDTVAQTGSEKDTEIRHGATGGADKAAPMSNSSVAFSTGDDGISAVNVTGSFGGTASALRATQSQEKNDTTHTYTDRADTTTRNTTDIREYGTTYGADNSPTEAPYHEDRTRTGGHTEAETGTDATTHTGTDTLSYTGRTDKTDGTSTRTANLHDTDTLTFTNRNDTVDTDTTVKHDETRTDATDTTHTTATDGHESTQTDTTHTTDTSNNTVTSGSTETTRTGGTTGATSKSTASSQSQTQETKQETAQQETGRHRDAASILTGAVQYIESTSAWVWMMQQLEPCFYSLFEI